MKEISDELYQALRDWRQATRRAVEARNVPTQWSITAREAERTYNVLTEIADRELSPVMRR